MIKRVIGALPILFALLLTSSLVSSAPRNTASLTFVQDGVVSADDSVKVGRPVEIHGEGFRTFGPAWICPAGQFCIKTPVNEDGSFVIQTILQYTGEYIITVYQYKNHAAKDSEAVLVTALTVL